jgi:hypothetical protein
VREGCEINPGTPGKSPIFTIKEMNFLTMKEMSLEGYKKTCSVKILSIISDTLFWAPLPPPGDPGCDDKIVPAT